MKPIIYPYDLASETAKALAVALNTKRVKSDGFYRYRDEDMVINWGNSRCPNWDNGSVLVVNHWDAVANSVNKIKTFQILKQNNVSTVEWTINRAEAENWINAGKTVMCRTLVESSQGNGIVVAKTLNELVDCPLYTLYADAKLEFRTHWAGGKLIDFQEKKRSLESDNVNNFIRNFGNGWKFCRINVSLPQIVVDECRKAIKALGLDFGCVDVRFRVRDSKCFILEVGTAPALEGTTLESYVNAFKKLLNNEELTDIDYGNYVAEVRQAAPIPERIAETAQVQERPIATQQNNIEEILYHFPAISSLKVIKSNNGHILKFKVNGLDQQIII